MQKLVLIFVSTFFLSLNATAHEFYFAYAELSLNELTNRFEGTLIFTMHDIEKALDPKGNLIGKLESSDEASPIRTQLERYINQHINISYGCALDSNAIDAFCQTEFILEGIVPQLNGTIECFISAPAHAIYTPLNIQFDALLEVFPLQQNKLTFYYRENKYTLNFIPGNLIQSLPIKP
jgi:hypothetical protein